MRSSKMAAGSGRAAIFHHHHNGGRKTLPRSWLTSFPAPPSWNQDGGATNNVWRTFGLPWNPQKGVVLVQKTSRRRLKFTLNEIEKHLIVCLPQPFSKWLRELPSCHYGEVDQSARVNTTFHEMWCWLRQAPTLLFFFNCTLQYTRIIVEYSVIVGRSLVWLETNPNPTMTILLFSSILLTKRQWQSSTITRSVWQCKKSVMSRIQSTDHEEAIVNHQHQNGELARWWRCPDCDSQKAQHEAPSAALQSACPATLHS